ncbi:MAG: hypothetical protein ACOC2U_02270, partial [bacterium]
EITGEYSDTTTYECCGDDDGEYYRFSEVAHSPGHKGHVEEIADDNSIVCCDNINDCVYQNTCYDSGSFLDTDGNDESDAMCYSGKWYDADTNQNYCSQSEADSDFPYCNGNECWVKAGEITGEYSDTTTYECCGDDPNEFYISWNQNYLNQEKKACCDNSNDCVDLDGNCQLYQYETGDLCSDGIDNDCDGLIDCEDDSCTCGTYGPDKTICNGIAKYNNGFYGALSVKKDSMTFGNFDYCSDILGDNSPCLIAENNRNSQIKCGNSDEEIFGICYQDSCDKISTTNFEISVTGDYSCETYNPPKFKHEDTLKLDLSFIPEMSSLNSWNFFAECKLEDSKTGFIDYTNSWIVGYKDSKTTTKLSYVLDDSLLEPELVKGSDITLDLSCYIYTDLFANNGWQVSDIISKELIITAACNDECLIENQVISDGTTNSDLGGNYPCYYCNPELNQFNWTIHMDGERCNSLERLGASSNDEAGLCCQGECSTLSMTNFGIESEHTSADEKKAFWLDMSCLKGNKVGQIKCENSGDLVCDNLRCMDEDQDDGFWDLDYDDYIEYKNYEPLCDQDSDCDSSDGFYICSDNCFCKKVTECTINDKKYLDTKSNPDNPCQICNVSNSITKWSNLKEDTPCGEWKCSSDKAYYRTTSQDAIYGVLGACEWHDSISEMQCTGVSDFVCADSDLKDLSHGTQKIACQAECDSPYDEDDDGNSCLCLESVSDDCTSGCEWKNPCEGIEIIDKIFYCGESDNLCPEDFTDPNSQQSPNCNTENYCNDPDC